MGSEASVDEKVGVSGKNDELPNWSLSELNQIKAPKPPKAGAVGPSAETRDVDYTVCALCLRKISCFVHKR